MKLIKITYVLVIFVLMACGNSLSPLEYTEWVENPNNGLKQEKEIDGYRFSLQYQPQEYLVVNELRQKEIKQKQMDEALKRKEGMQYFTLKLSTTDNRPVFSGNKNISDSVNSYLNYQLRNDFYLVEAGDTLPCQLFHYENTNGLTPYDAFVLGFDKVRDSIVDKELVFDAGIIGLEHLSISVNKAAINKIPQVKTL